MVNVNSNNTTITNQTIGNKSAVINGDDGTINQTIQNITLKTITPSEIYKVCEILDGNLVETNDLSYAINPDWLCKMEFNTLQIYKKIFMEYSIFYESVAKVFSSSTINGPSLLRRINTIYNDVLLINANVESDKIVHSIISKLRDIVNNSYQNTTLTHEHIEDVLISVVFFAFTRCKILNIPPKEFCQ
ncbi:MULTISPECIES: hypothetical protein [Lysinibacillus]|uniref:Uncharacterized protein n=1 Tax=Lysinibacillus varians TaxID=1145276 RepID=A0ABY2T5T3_9BACI|nr:hypothetical protein [Lysinibacillus varians]AHN24268.1 hypothetical protein T479_12660 [Lysinibacillus varians]QPQ35541.1 hypothetical protein JNUCC52_00965 [Lysinibacillus sp. JNUCC-52]TKI52589.1 hypothetical protein FC752_18550 [Lysinibacillus varians]